jgi:hypothetical protein
VRAEVICYRVSRRKLMRLLQSCFVLLVVPVAWAQQSRPAGAPEKRDVPLTRSSFSASGLHYEDTLTSFFAGNFMDIPFNRENMLFLLLFERYLEAYGRHCGAYLPAGKVELTRSVCAVEEHTVNRYGVSSAASGCAEYRTAGMGIYADPTLYAAKSKLDNEQGVSAIKDALRTRNPLGAALSTLIESEQMADDMKALVRLNDCAGPGLKRFQENLMLFSIGKQPIPLPGAAPPVPSPAQTSPPGVFKDQNYTRLLEDLVADQAKTWLMNRFVPGSTSNVVVTSCDEAGRPSKLVGRYLFNGRSPGFVTVAFTDGVPACLYFFDFPSTCKTPNRRLVAAYSSGGYR